MTVPDVNAPPVGEHGAPCVVCAAPLASDQRYCLSCGTRRAEARLPFREILTTAAVSPAIVPVVASARREPLDEGGRSALLALASIGCLLLALGVGVLIGGSGDSGAVATPPAQVVTLGGATGATGAVDPGAAASPTPKGSSSSKPSGSKSSKPAATPTSSNKAIQKLQKLSPTQYQKQSQKLPKVVGTGGAPPPKDNKPAAGGGGFQSIG